MVQGKIVKVRWIDINKGDEENPCYRSRLVAKEFKRGTDNPELFAATPPLEAMRLILSNFATRNKYCRPGDMGVMVNDVSRAYFYAPITVPLYIELPQEDYD